MIEIVENRITMTRGDTLVTTVEVIFDEEPYIPVEGDKVRFAVKHPTMNADKTEYTDAVPLILKDIPIDTMELTLEPDDTQVLGFGKYDYDCEITFANGIVQTFISDKLILTKEVH